MSEFDNNNKKKIHDLVESHNQNINTPSRTSASARERDILIRTICHEVFPETTRRLGTGDKYRNMVAVFSPSATERAKRALYGRLTKADDGFVLFDWLQSIKVEVGLKIEFLQIVARSLGDDWNDDSRSFIDVTIAMSRLQVLLRKLCQHELTTDFSQQGSAIIAVPPGEAHQFGQCIVEELFSTRGWVTELFVPQTIEELLEHILRADHDIVCISWSSSALTDIVKQTISALEASTREKRPAIIAGGSASLDGGNWMVNLGVDCICDSAYSAMNIAENLLAKSRLEELN